MVNIYRKYGKTVLVDIIISLRFIIVGIAIRKRILILRKKPICQATHCLS